MTFLATASGLMIERVRSVVMKTVPQVAVSVGTSWNDTGTRQSRCQESANGREAGDPHGLRETRLGAVAEVALDETFLERSDAEALTAAAQRTSRWDCHR